MGEAVKAVVVATDPAAAGPDLEAELLAHCRGGAGHVQVPAEHRLRRRVAPRRQRQALQAAPPRELLAGTRLPRHLKTPPLTTRPTAHPRSSIVIRSPVLPRFAVEPPDHAPEGTHRIGSVPLTGGGTAWVVHAHRRGRIPSATWRRDRTWSAARHGARIRRRGTEMRAVDLWAVPKLVVDGDPFEPWGVHVEAPLDGARPVR
jgi:hypothetical protein